MTVDPTVLVVLGDVHGALDAHDVAAIDALGAHAVICVGDLGGMRWAGALPVAALLSTLRTPTYLVPGNHDAVTLPQLVAEATGQRVLADRLSAGMTDRLAALDEALAPAVRIGWSGHDVGRHLHVVAGRPHAFGGPTMAFERHLREVYGVADLEASAARLVALVDAAPADRALLFVAHNGPTGLGDDRAAPFGRDFHRDEGDWGDPDLAVAVRHAVASGRRVAGVIAGHMHRRLKGGGLRRITGLLDGVGVVNAARVPRTDRSGRRHHVRVEVRPGGVTIDDVLLGPGAEVQRLWARGWT